MLSRLLLFFSVTLQGRDSGIEEDVVSLSTGRIYVATSKDGLVWEQEEGIGTHGSSFDLNTEEWWVWCHVFWWVGSGGCRVFLVGVVRVRWRRMWRGRASEIINVRFLLASLTIIINCFTPTPTKDTNN
jgi:hypothetical protein